MYKFLIPFDSFFFFLEIEEIPVGMGGDHDVFFNADRSDDDNATVSASSTLTTTSSMFEE